nr:MAG TPA: hypothetical protein [Caudoviricetes sp.]
MELKELDNKTTYNNRREKSLLLLYKYSSS